MRNRFIQGLACLAALLAGCATKPPERVERDRAVLTAIQPCWLEYADIFSMDRVTVNQDGTVHFWYDGRMVTRAVDARKCINEHAAKVRVGPWAPGRLLKSVSASVPITTAERDVIARVLINGVPGNLAIRPNTGLTSVTPTHAERVGLRIVPQSPQTRLRIGEKTVPIPFARAGHVQLGDATVEALDVAVYDALLQPGVDGILGRTFLSHFKVTTDRRARRLTLEPL